MDGLTPEEKADFALLEQANERSGFVIEVGSNEHQALNRAIKNEWVRLIEIDQSCSACSGSLASATGAYLFSASRGRRRLKRFFKMTA